MTGGVGPFESIAAFVGEALASVADHLTPEALEDLVAELGVQPPEGLAELSGVPEALTAAQTAATDLGQVLPPLATAIEAADPNDVLSSAAIVAAGADVIVHITRLITALRELVDAGRAAAPIATPEIEALADELAADLPSRLLERLILDYVDTRALAAAEILPLFGLIEDVEAEGDTTGVLLPYRRRRLHLERFARLLTDPASYLEETFGFGQADFDGLALFQPIEKLLRDNGHAVTLLTPPDELPVLEAFLVRLVADPSFSPPALRMRLRVPAIAPPFELEQPIGGVWTFKTSADASFDEGLEVVLTADGGLRFEPATGEATATLATGLVAEDPDGAPMTVLGLTGGTRLELDRFEAAAGVEARWDAAEGAAIAEPTIAIDIEHLSAVIDLGGGDSFLKDISGGGSGAADVTVGGVWSPASGVRFTGSSALEISVPSHVSIGPATLETIYMIADFDGDTVPVELSAAVRGELGPASASVDRVGVTLNFSAPETGGNLGPLNLDVDFKPPNGIGLSVDGGGMVGGGYLYLDPERGEYAGALELKFQDLIHLKAVGVLNTIMPDGSEGFSLVVIISAEFTPIQLGFGITLNGVGGLVGVNRTMLLDVLRNGVRDGTLDSILFPENVVANAPAIIADLKEVFPPLTERYLIGPMGKLGWGTPTLVTLELGVILEIPQPAFAIVGILEVVLPADEVAILELNVSFVGTVDFEKRELTFDASLYDSQVIGFTLSGDLALRIYWGENANFLLSAGGFHPSYSPPPLGVPDLNRLAFSMIAGNPSLTAESYFAVTSNTVQFGGRVEAYAGEDIFNIYGFVSLDALIQFDPFYFIVDLSAMVAARSGSKTLFSVKLSFTLEGPTPWHAKGRASFEVSFILTIEVSIRFDVTVGDARTTTLPPVRVLDLLEAALENPDSWRAIVPADIAGAVALRDLGDAAPQVVHPFGSLAVTQRVVPLNMAIERFGSRGVEGGDTYTIDDFSVGGVGLDANTTKEDFASAQFLDMSDAQKLSQPSFEKFDAGLEAATSATPQTDFSRVVEVEHELIYLEKPRPNIFHRLAGWVFDSLLRSNAVALSTKGHELRTPTGLGTPAVTLATGSYVVATVDELTPYEADLSFGSEAEATVALSQMVAADPALAGRVQVVRDYELAA